MSISYRLTAGAMLVVFAAALATDVLLPSQPPRGTISTAFDPCTMWEQLGLVTRMSGLVWFITLIPVTAGGLRNRPFPRWIAILCVIAFAIWARYSFSFWRWQRCSSAAQLATGTIWYVSVLVMCLHQVLQRRTS